jgi:hypothetical protein
MMRVLPVLAVAIAISACASKAPQPAAAPPLSAAPYASPAMEVTPAAAAWATVSPRLSQRAQCFENRGVWRPTAYVCEYEGL